MSEIIDLHKLGVILWIWFVHAAIAAALSAPIVFLSRARVNWHYWEALALVLPFATWTLFSFSSLAEGKKSLSNLSEPVYLAIAIPIIASIRVIAGPRIPEGLFAGILLAVLCTLAAVLFFVIPPLPE